MCQMLLSINPEYVESILNGTKLYEYRKFKCRDDVDKIIIYATTPWKQVVGEAEIEYIIEDDVLSVWRQTKEHSGITYNFFRKYYKGKKKAFAYRLTNVKTYEEALALQTFGISSAPQSYRYLSV